MRAALAGGDEARTLRVRNSRVPARVQPSGERGRVHSGRGGASFITKIMSRPRPRERGFICSRWKALASRWEADPGDVGVEAQFAELRQEAVQLDAPSEMQNLHALLLSGMRTQSRAYRAYLKGAKKESEVICAVAAKTRLNYLCALETLELGD